MTYPVPSPPAPQPVDPPEYPTLRESEEIQGNILAGFRKDRQQLIFIAFGTDQTAARAWLGEVIPRVATTAQVATFNDAFSAARQAAGGDPSDLAAIWVNLSLSAHGISALAATDPFVGGTADVFVNGAAASAPALGDTGDDAPDSWLFGRAGQLIDAVLTVQADRESDFDVELQRQRDALARHGLTIAFEQPGRTLPSKRAGHEHFGFKDGISQPGVRGFDKPSATKPDEVDGQPGTDLINPGAFVLGYPDQSGTVPAVPGWMHDGSFHVIRRLAQDVPGWWGQVEAQQIALADPSTTSDLLAAKLVGRWRSGTPLAVAPDQDLRSGRLENSDNDFEYSPDPNGESTPRFAHIRKVYPRDANPPSDAVSEAHRIIRRGIPFGLPFDPAAGRGHGVDAERGLVFAAFMASIEDQFEFLQRTWANNVDFPNAADGSDPVIGTDSDVTINRTGKPPAKLHFARFVHTEGALYAFAPSVSTLTLLAQGGGLPQ